MGGNAYSKKAVKNIFKLKKRPSFNPLIVHYFSFKEANKDVVLNKNFFKLYKKFCPGPITFVLKKKTNSRIHSLVSAKLKTVAIRFPSHPIVRSVLKNINFPLAMPSANLSTKVSPVCAKDVSDEFKKNIRFIFDGGNSKIGIESTVVDLTKKPKIIRPGIILPHALKKLVKLYVNNENSKIVSPGMLKKHYSPGIPIFLNQKILKTAKRLLRLEKNTKITIIISILEKIRLERSSL